MAHIILLCFTLFCLHCSSWWAQMINLPLSFRITSLALGQSYDLQTKVCIPPEPVFQNMRQEMSDSDRSNGQFILLESQGWGSRPPPVETISVSKTSIFSQEHSFVIQQGKIEGFDSCDQPSNLAQIGSKSNFLAGVTSKNNKEPLPFPSSTLSQEHSFISWQWMLLPTHSCHFKW